MKLTPRDRVLLGIIPILALCAAFYVLVLMPQRHTAARLKTQINAAQTQLESAQQNYQAGHTAAVALKRDVKLYASSRIAVPQVSNIPAMLRLLQRSANGADVSIQTISLSGASAGSSTGSTTGGAARQDGATMVPVALTLTGGYQALNRLVRRLDRYVVVTRHGLHVDGPLFGISSVSESPESGLGLSIQLTTVIYQYSAASTVEGSNSEGSS